MKTFSSIAVAIVFSASLMAQTSADLKLNLEKNKTYRVKSINEQSTSITMGGNQQLVDTKSITVLSLKSVNSGTDFITAEIRFDTISTKVSYPKMEMTSTKTGNIKSSDMAEVVSCFLNRLSKATFTVKMAFTGNVIEITNLTAVTNEVLKGTDSIQEQMRSMVKLMVEEKAVKGMIESITAYLPGKQVQVGDKWETHVAISSRGIGMLLGNSFKLKKVTGDQAEVTAETTIEPASQVPVEMNGAQITYDVRGLGKSSLTIDTKTGWIVKMSSKSHNQGNMNVKAQGNDMQMPLEVEGKTEIVAIP